MLIASSGRPSAPSGGWESPPELPETEIASETRDLIAEAIEARLEPAGRDLAGCQGG